MSIFDNIFGSWVRIEDEENILTIEDYPYETGVITSITDKHCAKCTAVNKCWFKEEENKYPKPFSITGIKLIDNALTDILPGYFHFRCHCQIIPHFPPTEKNIKLIIPSGKIDWLFSNKGSWIEALGYKPDYNFIEIMEKCIKEAYCAGNYEIQSHTHFGVKINIIIDLLGANEKQGKVYKLKSNFMVFPNGKLKCNTLIGGWAK